LGSSFPPWILVPGAPRAPFRGTMSRDAGLVFVRARYGRSFSSDFSHRPRLGFGLCIGARARVRPGLPFGFLCWSFVQCPPFQSSSCYQVCFSIARSRCSARAPEHIFSPLPQFCTAISPAGFVAPSVPVGTPLLLPICSSSCVKLSPSSVFGSESSQALQQF
jgi:hypothetical protein